MKKLNKSLKEWNAVVEALGQGKQSILVRKYSTNNKVFLLNPTLKYALKDNYLSNFQKKYYSFVEKFRCPEKEKEKVAIKYFATVEEVFEKSPNRIGSLKDNFIWNPDHIKEYLKGNKAFIWVLRVYKLDKPYMVSPTPNAIIYANLNEFISISKSKPVLNDNEFKKILNSVR